MGVRIRGGQRKEKSPFLPFGPQSVSLFPLIFLPSKPPTPTLVHSLTPSEDSVPDTYLTQSLTADDRSILLPLYREEHRGVEAQ